MESSRISYYHTLRRRYRFGQEIFPERNKGYFFVPNFFRYHDFHPSMDPRLRRSTHLLAPYTLSVLCCYLVCVLVIKMSLGGFNLQRMMGGGGAMNPDAPMADTSEQVYISSLALLKMLKHGRAGVPMEVMGLMLGEFVDDFTVKVVDVFSMPQTGNSVSVEAVDPVFQTKMLDMLKQTGRPETVVGWYHSHPGFGCWLSGTDINTQQSFEQLNPRAVGVVVDPIQSVKGKVVIDCFRLINPQTTMMGQEARQTTSNIGHLNKPTITALIHGLNRHYYSIAINYKKNTLEQQMLRNLYKSKWQKNLTIPSFVDNAKNNLTTISSMKKYSTEYAKNIKDELTMTEQEILVKNVGKTDPKKALENDIETIMAGNIVQSIATQIGVTGF
jgi:26S proteasome regulatory subunit N11